MNENSGMTRIQLLILLVIVIVIGVFSYPPWAEYRKVSQADVDVEMLAIAIKKYYKHTQTYPANLEQLVTDPGVDGWRRTYLKSCLLYTSPSPRDRTRSRMPSSA